jgi:ABC-type sugar transport system permease subunit
MKELYTSIVALFGVVAIGLGVALLVETAVRGGGVGYLLGLLFLALGAGRLYLLWRRK